jgi:hypothetical protein
MTRAALEHLLRAASALTNEEHFVVIGSQAVLGQEGLVNAAALDDRVKQLPLESERIESLRARLRRLQPTEA